jgi:hypothetical protein
MDADRCSLSISHLPELTRRRGVATCRYIAPGCMADADLTARLFASGVLEASAAYVQRARTSDVSPHVSVNRGVGQFIAGVASTAEGRARLLTTEGVEDALMWLLEYGGEPVGIAENRSVRWLIRVGWQDCLWRYSAGVRKTRRSHCRRRSSIRSYP